MIGASLVCLFKRQVTAAGGGLDTQTVTTGNDPLGVGNPDYTRRRGFSTGGGFGSISDGTSNIYGGAAITDFYWDENGGETSLYTLTITGATNSGWTQVVIGGSKTLLRGDASFASSTWTWTSPNTISTQAFGSVGTNHTCVFT